MTTKFTFIFILIISFTLSLVAQDRSVAYVFTKANGGPASQEVNKNLISELSKNYGYDLYFYNYNVEKELTYLPELNGNKEEKTAKYLRQFSYDLLETYKPDILVSLDTNKNVTGVFFQLNPNILVRSKTTDLETSQIVQNSKTTLKLEEDHFTPFKSRINITNWKALFGGNPDAVKAKDPKKYAALYDKLITEHSPKMEGFFKQKGEVINRYFVNEQLHLLDESYSKIQNPEVSKEKLNKFKIIPERKGSNYVAAYTSVFTLDTLNNYIYSTMVSLFVGNTEKDGSIIFSRAPFQGGKEAAEAIAAGKQLYYEIGSQGYGDKIVDQKNVMNLGVNTPDPDFNATMELYFNKMSGVKLFDISNKELIGKFREKYKSGQFINDKFEVKEQGLNYLLTASKEKIEVSNVENGSVVGSFNADDRYPVVYNSLLDALKLNIEVIMITKEKKGKAQELLLYSPLGFTHVEKLEVFAVDVEKVNGKELERRTKIGELKPTNEAFDDAKGRTERRDVKDGDKEIFEAIKAGKKVVVRISEKVGMFGKIDNMNSKLGKLNGLK
ncbi:MAG: hypothetical protein WAR99_17175 [Saprospiraceae bacterium]|jgi:hypothetical protein